MDHLDVRERLEVAAVEPDGFDRLVAGDTGDAAAVAGHLAGCPSCTEEFGRLRRSAAIIRDTISTQPAPELRARTLAFVASVGRVRDGGAGAEAASGARADGAPAAVPPISVQGGALVGRRSARLGWVFAAAAVLALAVGGWLVSDRLRDQSEDLAALGRVTAWQLRVDAQPDAQRVVLTAPTGEADGPRGSLAFSRTSEELVVTATGLEPPGAGREYRCWVSVDGERERLGRMYFSADIAYWVGRAEVLDRVTPGSTFGVSLTEPGTSGAMGEPVIAGTL